MNIEKKENYTLLTTESTVLSETLKNLSVELQKHAVENIILHISDNLNIKASDFSVFLNIASDKKASETSFVVVDLHLAWINNSLKK